MSICVIDNCEEIAEITKTARQIYVETKKLRNSTGVETQGVETCAEFKELRCKLNIIGESDGGLDRQIYATNRRSSVTERV